MKADIKRLIQRLNPFCTRSLEAASGLCVNRSNYEVSCEHILLQMLDDPQGDISLLLKHYDKNPSDWIQRLQTELESLKSGNPGKPVFAPGLVNLLEDAWMTASLDLGQGLIRSGAILLQLIDNPLRFGMEYLPGINDLSVEDIIRDFHFVAGASVEESQAEASPTPATARSETSSGHGSNIEKYTTNFTQRARDGKIDPVFGRDHEIRQMIDILGRRRKNNPIAVGEAGVGKTAVIEGLALKIAEGDVPDIIKDVEIIGLDLGLLQAGASVKGEFENRLNGVINEIKASPTPLILFIDEAHTLIGAGGAAGTGDAANLLKPALARGELRTIAATTWSEYKKYFEKDPALARRFQPVKLDEPSPDEAAVILRGLRAVYEKAHDVYVRDEAIKSAAEMSARYISGRQLPDKAVDLLDTACARVKISLSTKPAVLEELEQKIKTLARERDALKRDVDSGRSKNSDRLEELNSLLLENQDKVGQETAAWNTELTAVNKVIQLRQQSSSEEADQSDINNQLKLAIIELEKRQGDHPMISYEVTPEVISQVIADWTGIPVGNLVKDEASSLLDFNDQLKRWVKGQDHAVDMIDSGVRTAKAGLQNPDQPIGIFLFVGPSGVGKTETALGVANLMFGGDRFMVTVNMSEYQEKHTVSRLVGSPAGYVGYGEGGVLTEAVRQRPYSVVLLDEVEKADLEVMNLFYQVFDKGNLSDGEGRVIDFKNTIVFLTSNLASDIIMEMCSGDTLPTPDEITEAIRPVLQNHFKPALLGRMNVIPFYPLKGEVLKDIVKIKLNKVTKRLKQSQRLELIYGDDVIDQIYGRCTDVESGARNVDHIINRTLLPQISTEILQRIGDEEAYTDLRLSVSSDGAFVSVFK